MKSFLQNGFRIVANPFTEEELDEFCDEAERVAEAAGSACVRHLRSRSEVFSRLACDRRLSGILPGGLIPVRSILFDKTPAENWPVAWHQDLTIAVAERMEVENYGPWSTKDGAVHVQPPVAILQNMVTLRIHLDPTPESNGALRVIPASHLAGKIEGGKVAEFIKGEVVCECQRGDILMMSPLILHSSKRSIHPSKRRVIHFEYARPGDLAEGLRWRES